MSRPAPPVPRSGSGGVSKFRRQRHVSDEGKQRLSELAKRRHQAGGFEKSADGSKPAKKGKKRGPSKRRIAELVAEEARSKKTAQEIIDVFKDCLQDTQPANIRLKAAETLIKIDQEDAKLKLREESEAGQRRDRGQLLEALSEGLTSGYTGHILRQRLAQQVGRDDPVIEGTVLEES